MTKPGQSTRSRTALRRLLGRAAAVAGVVVTGIAMLSVAQRDVMASPQSGAEAQKTKKYLATREITLDKVTGKLRKPTPTETQELVDTLNALIRPATGPQPEGTLPSGATVMNLAGQFAPVMLARPNADGTTEVKCVTSFDEAAEFLGLVEDPSQQ